MDFDYSNILELLGGLALFLYGMKLLGASLEKCAGSRLKLILSRLTNNALRAFVLGAGFTAIIQSSSATTVMVVGFVNSGLMTLSQSIPIIIGANVGTTVTGWILSLAGVNGGAWYLDLLKPATFTPAIAFIGIVIYMTAKRQRRKDGAQVALGFAILMFGMEMMSGSVKPLAELPEFTKILTMFENPVLGLLAGALLTAAIQSSSATVGILQALSVTGAITYSSAVPIIMGIHIGASIPVLISSIGTTTQAKRTSLVYLFLNVIGAVFWMIVYYALTSALQPAIIHHAADPLGLAVLNTGYKVLCAALVLPFRRQLEALVCRCAKESDDGTLSLLDERLFVTPTIALDRARGVLLEMGDLSCKILNQALDMVSDFDNDIAQQIIDGENEVDMYEDKLGTFLVKLSSRSMSERDNHELTKYLHILSDYERISDHAVNILNSAQEKHDKEIRFSEQAWQELGVLTKAIREILDLCRNSLRENDLGMAGKVEPLEQVIDDLTRRIKSRHIDRLTRGECTIEFGFVLNDLLTNLERVSDHCSNVAVCVIEIAHNSLETHEYLHDEARSAQFQQMYESFGKTYALPEATKA